MDQDRSQDFKSLSPLDPYISQALSAIALGGAIPSSGLSQYCSTRLGWLPGFTDVIITVLRTNRLIVVNDWEPGKVHITHRGQRWIDSTLVSR